MGKVKEERGNEENVITHLLLSKSTSEVMLHPKTIYPREGMNNPGDSGSGEST